MVGLTKTVALEIARSHITCNAICPGFVRTPLAEAQIAPLAKAHNVLGGGGADRPAAGPPALQALGRGRGYRPHGAAPLRPGQRRLQRRGDLHRRGLAGQLMAKETGEGPGESPAGKPGSAPTGDLRAEGPLPEALIPLPPRRLGRCRSLAVAKPVATKRLNLALQGGGTHGAFTWGALDRLLEDERIVFDGVSGTSAGGINAAIFVQGLAEGGREGAKKALDRMWRDVAGRLAMSPLQNTPLEKALWGYDLT
ncbi:patatin-like phospholipase family protein [Dankookia sp. P2]|uniref:patatin-like phospholipase family protein n=1 Tax=Dankookia sp. P2 TaxID=3423955 RepID=UPI003D66EE5B